MKRSVCCFCFLCQMCALLAGCDSREPGVTVITGEAMGTRYHITLLSNPSDLASLEAEVATLMEEIEQQASQWRRDSWVSRFNRQQANVPMPAPDHVAAMILEAEAVYVQTSGAFDITAGPLVELWGFGVRSGRSEPTEVQIAEALERTGFDKLTLNDEASVVSKGVAGMELDFSGLAKGYAVDRVAELLISSGLDHFLISFGGELRAVGDGPRGDGWVVEVEDGDGQAMILHDQGCATSGGAYQQRDTSDGRAVTHLIDPRTGRPIRDPGRSVTVIADRCVLADAWATALAIDESPEMMDAAQRAGIRGLDAPD